MTITFYSGGQYIDAALSELARFMRDPVNQEIGAIDRKLFDYLFELYRALGTKEPFRLHTAFRSKATNEAWAVRDSGVARDSYHLRGQAADVSLPGYSARDLAVAAGALKRGGVGLYGGATDFVHLDTGAPRSWGF